MMFEKITDISLNEIAQLLKALSDTTRLKIMKYLHEGEHCVTEIVHSVGSSQANISKHLQLLVTAGLLTSRKEGTTVYYQISDPVVNHLCGSICSGYKNLTEKKYQKILS